MRTIMDKTLFNISPTLSVIQNPSSVPAVSQACLGAQALSIQKASADGLMRLMRQLGAAAKELWKYDCRKAVQGRKRRCRCDYLLCD